MDKDRDLGRRKITCMRAVAAGLTLVAVGVGIPFLGGRHTEAIAQTVEPVAADIIDEGDSSIIISPDIQLSPEELSLRRLFDSFEKSNQDQTAPRRWKPIGNADYNYLDGSGNGSPSSVSGRLIARTDPFGCLVEGGSWKFSKLIHIRTSQTLELGADAKKVTLDPNFSVDAFLGLSLFNNTQQLIGSVGSNLDTTLVEGVYVTGDAFTMGPGGIPWSENIAYVQISLSATGFRTGGVCPDGSEVGEVFFDNAYFGPVR